MNCRLAAAVADGLRRSPTLQTLAGRLASLDGIVYVVFDPAPPVRKTLLGSLSHHVTRAGSTTILRVTLHDDRGDAVVATVAHEFQHAIEVLQEADARTEESILALFERIGRRTAAGVYETAAAIEVERSVMRELHTRPAARP